MEAVQQMSISVDYTLTPWLITIPKSDLILDTGTKYNLTVDVFWQLLRDYADSSEGVASPNIYSRVAATASTPSITEVNENYFELQFEDGLYSVNIINGNTNIRNVEVKNQVSVNTNNTTGFIDPTFLEAGLFPDAVVLDAINGFSGVGKTGSGGIIGTRQTPSNNTVDSKLIAIDRGFDTIHVNNNIAFEATDILDNLIIEGDNQSQSTFTFISGATTGDASFLSACLTGELSGALFVENCAMVNLSGVGCTTSISRFINCAFEGGYVRLRADNDQEVHFVSCENAAPDAELDINGSIADVRAQQYSGDLKLTNLTAGNTFIFNATGGHLIIDASCTNGHIILQGDVRYENNGTVTIEDETSAALTWLHSKALTLGKYLGLK
jgi:hypothetical protein